MKPSRRLLSGAFGFAIAFIFAMPAVAQDADADDQELIEEVITVGTRGAPRSAIESPVPVDTFDIADLNRQGHGDMTETIRNLVPSFSATPLTGDGSAFVRSTSLRGLPPDDVLLLVNGKRRHRSALIQHFGAAMSSGAHAADMGQIPSIALKNVEVLRDGAASQYGSDAIAGVINFVLRDASEGGEVQLQYGQFYEGETTYKIAANIGVPFLDDGFINLSGEYVDHEQLIRGFQPEAAATAITAGIPDVGTDSPYSGDTLAQTWGRPENRGLRTAWNIGLNVSDTAELYVFGNFADTYGNYRFFYRAPNHADTLSPVPIDPTDPSQGNFCWCDTELGGFTPYLEGNTKDFSTAGGVRGELDGGTTYDVSVSYGMNRMEYTLNNTLNTSFGPTSPRVFNTGNLEEREINFNADFSKAMTDIVTVSYGFEWREETYEMFAGDRFSWEAGPWTGISSQTDPVTGTNYIEPGIGSNGMVGTNADGAGIFARDNIAVYVDVEWDLSDAFLLQAALRYEDFSDFGTTTNGKIAARFTASDRLTLRGAVSTGFRAPTPGQSNLTGIVTTFDGATGLQVQQGTVKPTDPLAVSLGGKALEPEDAFNISLGLAASLSDDLSLTLDWYQVEVDERIAKTQDIAIVNPLFSTLSFYTNALETETTGVDLVVLYDYDWASGNTTNLSFAYNYNKTEVTKQNQVNGIDPVSASNIFNIENNLPTDRFSVTVYHDMDRWSLMARANYYGDTIDERNNREPVDAEIFVDLEIGYEATDDLRWTFGFNNIFDTFPNPITTRVANGLAHPRRTPMGYDGGMAFVRATMSF